MICHECGQKISGKEFWASKTIMTEGQAIMVYFHVTCYQTFSKTLEGLEATQ